MITTFESLVFKREEGCRLEAKETQEQHRFSNHKNDIKRTEAKVEKSEAFIEAMQYKFKSILLKSWVP